MKEDNVVGYECRFAVHTPSKYNDGADLHFVKEIKHFKDGTTKPSIRLIENYKRDFYITKKGFRNHKTKKEREEICKLTKYSTTQSKLEHAVAHALEEPWKAGQRSGLRGLCQSPYVYGTDILSTSLIKKSYADKWPGLVTPNTVAVYDIETDVIRGTKEIIMATISFKDRVFTAIHKDHVKGHYGVEEKLDKLLTKYLSEYIVSRNVKWEVKIVETPADCVIQCIKKAHEWQPDFLAIWNIDFDIPTSVAALQKVGIDPATVFSDPIVPKKYQYFDYKQGSKQKVTASGKKSPIPPSQQWHTVFTPASFYIIDAMCVYRQIRAGQAELPSYALDYVMNNHLDRGKLKFEEADELSGIDWHVFMQETYPLEYVIYNVFDCIGMELLDEKILDLQLSFPIMAEFSDFCNFKSQPRRLCDTVHFECLESGYVFASTSDKMGDELDLLTVSCNDWINCGIVKPLWSH